MNYAVSEEGVSALKKTSSMLTEAWSGLFSLCVSLQNNANEHPDTLGPHRASLLSTLSAIYTALKESGEPIKTISDALNDTAEAYQEIIDNDRLVRDASNTRGSTGNSGATSGSESNTDYSGLSDSGSHPLMGAASFVPLLSTNQKVVNDVIDGKEVTVFDHPMNDSPWRICNQGSAYPAGSVSEAGITGTCGLCAGGSVVNKAGGKTSEKSMIDYALPRGLCGSDGGTSAEGIARILEDGAGIPSQCVTGESLDSLASRVEEGRGVIIGISAKTYSKEYGKFGLVDRFVNTDGHAVVIDSVVRDRGSGKPVGYYISDSNGASSFDAGRYVPAKILEKAFKRRGRSAVVTEIIW